MIANRMVQNDVMARTPGRAVQNDVPTVREVKVADLQTVNALKVDAASFTHVGHVRQDNQDRYLCVPATGLFVVADGLGGHPGGDVAAQLACTVIEQRLRDLEPCSTFADERGLLPERSADDAVDTRWTRLEAAIQAANAAVYEAGQADRQLREMATTIIAILLVPGGCVVAHVGDSRAYVVRREGDLSTIHQLMVDHQLDGKLTRAVGIRPFVEIGCSGFTLRPGDTLLLCSDGLHGLLSDDAIRHVVSRLDVGQAGQQLLADALQASGHDNVTGIVVRVD